MVDRYSGIRWLFGVLIGMLASSFALAAQIEAKGNGVKIYSDATNKSDVLGTLKRGETLECKERKGMYWQVTTTDGKTGFVSVLKVKRSAASNSGLAKAIRSVVKEGRDVDEVAEARSRSAVMGVRGLKAGGSNSAGDARPDLRAVYAMEDLVVSEKKIEKLGERVFQEISRKANM